MRKLIVTCECGQRLRVPYSALGRTGVCVTCGRTIPIISDTARREGGPVRGEPSVLRESRWSRRAGSLSEDAKERFGKAVDLYNGHRYAEALAIFDSFLLQFPGNPEIEDARRQCLNALKRGRPPALTDGSSRPAEEPKLDEATVKRVILEKMLYDPSSSVQLEAARLACQILGLLSDHQTPRPTAGTADPFRVKPAERNGPTPMGEEFSTDFNPPD